MNLDDLFANLTTTPDSPSKPVTFSDFQETFDRLRKQGVGTGEDGESARIWRDHRIMVDMAEVAIHALDDKRMRTYATMGGYIIFTSKRKKLPTLTLKPHMVTVEYLDKDGLITADHFFVDEACHMDAIEKAVALTKAHS